MQKRKENDGRVRYLREARLKHGKSLRGLSDDIGVNYTTISKWENGKRLPSEEHGKTLEDYFKTPIVELLKPIENL